MATGATGQFFTQIPQPVHFTLSTCTKRLPGTLPIAPAGHGLMHLSQPTHSFSITIAVPILASDALILAKAPEGHFSLHFKHKVHAPVKTGVAVTGHP